jgi:STE24 endopeptidase
MLRLLLPIAVLAAPLWAQAPPPIEPEQLRKAIEWEHLQNWSHFLGAVWSIALPLLLLTVKLGPRLAAWAERVSKARLVQAYLFTTLFVLVADVAGLPLEVYNHHLSLVYQGSVAGWGWGSWFGDWARGELVQSVILGFLAWLFYGAIRRSPRRWWFHFWLIALPVVTFLIFIEPVVIDPLFFQFKPLAATQPDLVAQIGKVAAHGGLAIPPERMFEKKASQKLASLNASVEGLGASKRVVVWDTLIQEMSAGQILFVFGHEMGHYVMRHNLLQLAMLCALMLVVLFVSFHAIRWMLARWGKRWSIRGVDDWASMPLMMLTVAVFTFATEPLRNSFQRMLEHQADVYGLEVIHGIVPDSSQAAARALQRLNNLADPNPSRLIVIWLYDHPPGAERVRFALEYDPWTRGEARRYIP